MDGYRRGKMYFDKHLYDAAYQEWNEALAHSQDPVDRLQCLKSMGLAQYRMGKFHQANFLFSVAQNWADELPDEMARFELTIERLSTLRSMGLLSEGHELAEQALAIYHKRFSDHSGWVHLSGLHATFLLDLGEVEKADKVVEATLQRNDVLPLFRARLWKIRSQARLVQDQPAVAASLLEKARSIIVDEGTYRDRVFLFVAQAQAAAQEGRALDAARHLTETVGLAHANPERFNVVYAARVALIGAPLMKHVDPEAASQALAWGEANLRTWGRAHEAARYHWVCGAAPADPVLLFRLTESISALVGSRGLKDISPVSGYYSPLVYVPVAERIGREFSRQDIHQACLSADHSGAFSAQGVATVIRTYADYLQKKGSYGEALDELTQGQEVNPRLTMRLLFEHVTA